MKCFVAVALNLYHTSSSVLVGPPLQDASTDCVAYLPSPLISSQVLLANTVVALAQSSFTGAAVTHVVKDIVAGLVLAWS